MGKFIFRPLRVTKNDKKKILSVFKSFVQDNVRRRVDATGEALPKGVTLRDSGRMMRRIKNKGDHLEFSQDYTSHVNDRYNFIGVRPDKQAEFSKIVDDIIQQIIDRRQGRSS